MLWSLADDTRFNALFGPFLVQVRGGAAHVRMHPTARHSNLSGAMHGGALLAFADMAIFAAARGFGVIGAGGAVTLDLSAQFVGRARVDDVPVEARIELLRETGRMLFMRGLVVQPLEDADEPVLSFTATIRKAGAP